MKVWFPSLDEKGHTLLDLRDDFSFEYQEFDVDTEEFQTFCIGTLTDCRFQILFEIALNHFVRGQYGESIISAHAALERFREFYLLVGIISNGLDFSSFEKFWSKVGSQSERQFGAYHLMVMLLKKTVGQELSGNQVKYRNKVVHKGYFPNEGKSLHYCEAVLEIIQDGLGSIPNHEKEKIKEAMQIEYESRKPSNIHFEISIKPFLDLSLDNVNAWTDKLQEHLSQLKKQPVDRITWPNFLYD